jgi:2,5-diamino-6-(ribosylamino)-4(3H)-pyrimidinone 5'-phosphate reductase
MAGFESLSFPETEAQKLGDYMPPTTEASINGQVSAAERRRPIVTLTFATSLDSSLSLAPGTRTALSGPRSKAMTHYLRSQHEAICVGVGTVIADDPALNCRLAHATNQPRPVIIDPLARWPVTRLSMVLQRAREGSGKAPFVLTRLRDPPAEAVALVEEHGGMYICVDADESGRFRWDDIFAVLHQQGIHSVMVEGGGAVINSLLGAENHPLIDSVIVTIAPTWLGQGGVVVSPDRRWEGVTPVPAARLKETTWIPLGEDVVLCGRLQCRSQRESMA